MDNKTFKNCNFKQSPNQIHSKFSKPEYTYKEVSKNCKGLFENVDLYDRPEFSRWKIEQEKFKEWIK